MTISGEVLYLREKVAKLQATLELVGSELRAAWEKRDDAPMSAQSHLQSASFAVQAFYAPTNGVLSAHAAEIRAKAWGEFADYCRRLDQADRFESTCIGNCSCDQSGTCVWCEAYTYVIHGPKKE